MISKEKEPITYQELVSQLIWCKVMKDELKALEKKSNLDNRTITQRKKIIGCK
jgi:hypothetical protein